MSEVSPTPNLLEEIKVELDLIDESPTSEHAQRFEGLHRKLDSELSTIEGL